MRKMNRLDQEILKHLQRHFRSHVKIDYDFLMEPCIFYEYNGLWEIVYKLSSSGSYVGQRDTYIANAYRSIISHVLSKKEQQKFENEETYKKERAFQEEMEKRKAQTIKGIVPKEIYE